MLSPEKYDKSGVHVWGCDPSGEFLSAYFRQAMCDDRVRPILHALIGPRVEFLSVKAVFKNATTQFGTPWHKDWYYWCGSPKLSVWIALDDAPPDNGCLQMIPGSHKMSFDKEPELDTGEAGFSHRIDPARLEGLPVVDMQVKSGDAVFFHDQTLHGSYPNRIAADRWSFISTYRDATVKDRSQIWTSSILIEQTQAV